MPPNALNTLLVAVDELPHLRTTVQTPNRYYNSCVLLEFQRRGATDGHQVSMHNSCVYDSTFDVPLAPTKTYLTET